MNTPPIKVYGYRWVMLLAFMFINFTMQVLWICFAPVSGPAAQFYHVTDFEIGLLAMSFMFIYIPVAIPAAWAIDKFGFRKAVGFGALLLGAFGLLRGLFTADFPLTVIFTIGLAIAQPFLLNAFTKFAALWFPLKDRATIVGLVFLAMFIGIGVGEVLTPTLVLQFGLSGMQLIYGILTAISALVFLIVVREKPPTPANPPSLEARALILDGFKQILRQRNFWYLAIVLFIGNSVFNGLSTWVESIVRPAGLSINDAGDLAGAMLLGGIIGSIAMPALSDRLRKRKGLMVIGFLLAIPGMIGVAFGASYILLLAAFFWLGIFTTGIAPVAYQYGAEVTYPVPEGTSNGLFALAGQISVIFIFVMGWSKDALQSFVPSMIALIVLMVIGVILLTLLKESPMMKTPAIATVEAAES